MEVRVRDNNVDQALRALKKKLIREGVFSKVKDEQYFTPKGERRRDAKKKAIKRNFKKAVADLRKTGLTKEEATREARLRFSPR